MTRTGAVKRNTSTGQELFRVTGQRSRSWARAPGMHLRKGSHEAVCVLLRPMQAALHAMIPLQDARWRHPLRLQGPPCPQPKLDKHTGTVSKLPLPRPSCA